MKRSVGLTHTCRKWPTAVMWWLMPVTMTGTTIIRLPMMPTVITQAGSGPPMR